MFFLSRAAARSAARCPRRALSLARSAPSRAAATGRATTHGLAPSVPFHPNLSLSVIAGVGAASFTFVGVGVALCDGGSVSVGRGVGSYGVLPDGSYGIRMTAADLPACDDESSNTPNVDGATIISLDEVRVV